MSREVPTDEWLREYQLGASRAIARCRRRYQDDEELRGLLDLCETLVRAVTLSDVYQQANVAQRVEG